MTLYEKLKTKYKDKLEGYEGLYPTSIDKIYTSLKEKEFVLDLTVYEWNQIMLYTDETFLSPYEFFN